MKSEVLFLCLLVSLVVQSCGQSIEEKRHKISKNRIVQGPMLEKVLGRPDTVSTNLKENKNLNSKNSNASIQSESTNVIPSWTGTYNSKSGASLKVNGPASDGAVKFELVQGDESCAELVEGTAYLHNSAVANYYENKAIFTLTYNPRQIEISELGYEHGASCRSFKGMYKAE